MMTNPSAPYGHLRLKKKNPINPDDGVTHINIWLHGQEPLGRMLSHFYKMHFTHPVLGPFNSMEGLWYYVKAVHPETGKKDDTLRKLYGIKAKDRGKQLKNMYVENFRDIIIAANFYKIEQNPDLLKQFTESTLPFKMYFYYNDVLVEQPEYDWLVEGFEEIRRMFKENRRPKELDYSYALATKA